jgi:hypothetical protein
MPGGKPLPVVVVTLKNRTLSPTVRLFIDHARAVTREMRGTRAIARSAG